MEKLPSLQLQKTFSLFLHQIQLIIVDCNGGMKLRYFWIVESNITLFTLPDGESPLRIEIDDLLLGSLELLGPQVKTLLPFLHIDPDLEYL